MMIGYKKLILRSTETINLNINKKNILQVKAIKFIDLFNIQVNLTIQLFLHLIHFLFF